MAHFRVLLKLTRVQKDNICTQALQGRSVERIARENDIKRTDLYKVFKAHKTVHGTHYQLDPRQYPYGRIGNRDPLNWLSMPHRASGVHGGSLENCRV